MTRGPGGYGRYDDDPEFVGCPWAKSDMTPCVARDGSICVTEGIWSPQVCVGCGNTPEFLMTNLAESYPPARDQGDGNPRLVANKLKRLVREATAP